MTGDGIDEWIIYARISDDREGAGLGVDRQTAEARAHHERAGLGGTILTVCADNDLTANDRSKRYKTRPEYERMCQLLAARPGRRGVITWHADRLHRTPRQLEDFIDLVERTAAAVQTVKAGHIDLSTPTGRMIARQLCAVARYESEHKSERIKSKVAQLAAAGSIYGGGPRPFGYTRVYDGTGTRRRIVRDDIDPDEAAIVRECARRALAGHSLFSIRRWLQTEGVVTSTGKDWSMQSLKYMLTSGRLAGLREHRRQVIGKAVWDPIITVEQHEQLRALLTPRQPRPAQPRKYYLSGYVYCSDCIDRGIKMRAGPVGGKPKYKCPPDSGGCNGRVIGVEALEGYIDALLQRLMSDPAILAGIASREADTSSAVNILLERIAADERRLALLSAALDDEDDESIPEVVATMRTIRRRVAAAKQDVAGMGATAAATLNLGDLAQRWGRVGVSEKQATLALFVQRIVIGPAVRGRSRFDAARVNVVPAGGSVA